MHQGNISDLVQLLLQQQQQQQQLTPSPETAQSIPDYCFFIASTLFIDWSGLIYALWLLQVVTLVTPTRPSVVTAFQIPDTDTLLLI